MLRLWKELHLLITKEQKRFEQNSAKEFPDPTARSPPSRGIEAEPLLYGGAPAEGDRTLLLLERNARGAWRLKPCLRLHLYISDAPCGDASIYEQTRAPSEPQPTTSPASADSLHSAPATCGGGDADAQPLTCRLSVPNEAKPSAQPVVPAGCCSCPTGSSVSPQKTEHTNNRSNKQGGGGFCAGPGGGVTVGDTTSIPCDDAEQGRCNRAKRHRCTAVSNDNDNKSEPFLLSHERRPSDVSVRVSGGPDNGKAGPLLSGEEREAGGEGGRKKGEGGGGGAERMTFTGAKIIAAVKERGDSDRGFWLGSGEGRAAGELVLRIDREQEQVLGALRIKSSRSNIAEERRTVSMSCSDKLAKWAVLGLQVGVTVGFMWVSNVSAFPSIVGGCERCNCTIHLEPTPTRRFSGLMGGCTVHVRQVQKGTSCERYIFFVLRTQ